jgi:anthranilate synthase component 1
MYQPTLEEVRELAKEGNLVPVCREIMADLETPVSAYLKIARGDYSFLLESVEGGEQLARYSFLGTEPSLILKTGAEQPIDPLLPIEKELRRFRLVPVSGLPRFHGGMVGYLGYEVARYFERLPSPDPDPLGLPESVMMLADSLLVFDHLTHKIKVVSHAHLNGDVEAAYREATRRIDSRRPHPRYPPPPRTSPRPGSKPVSPGPRSISTPATSSRLSCHSAWPGR